MAEPAMWLGRLEGSDNELEETTMKLETRPLTILFLGLVALLIAACAPLVGKEPLATAPAPSPTAEPTAAPPTATPLLPTATLPPKAKLLGTLTPSAPDESAGAEVQVPAGAKEAVAWALTDALKLAGGGKEAELASIEEVQWRDSSLGCPQPGMMYLQVITPGYRFVIQQGSDTYEYHSSRGAATGVLCDEG
jgi:hypothetical protein